MKIVIILSAIREERKSQNLAKFLLKKMNERVSTELIDLKKINLPIFGTQPESHENIEIVRDILIKSDGIIFISPEYHQTYTSTLKNMVEYYLVEFTKKPIGVATTSAGKFGGVQASIHLQSLVLALGAYPIPTRLLIPEIQNAFNANNEPINADLEKNTAYFIDEFLDFTTALYRDKRNKGVISYYIQNNFLRV